MTDEFPIPIDRVIFTANQRQELNNQTLALRYLLSGIPIPSHLFSTLFLTSSTFSPIGWGCFQVGYGSQIELEPGRCRRTDGKKWRCSKEAHPNSKYCEKHMNRGKSKSKSKKKQVQPLNPVTATIDQTNSIPTALSASYTNYPQKCSSSLPYQYQDTSLSRQSSRSTVEAQNQPWLLDAELYDRQPNKTISFEF